MGGQKTIMFIDDDQDDKELFCEVVSDIDPGFKYLTAVNGEEALKVLNTLTGPLPDLILLDLNMPLVNGKQCLKEIKTDARFKNIPVIMYSTSKREADIKESKSLGASYFMSKPNTFAELKRSIAFILSEFLYTGAEDKKLAAISK